MNTIYFYTSAAGFGYRTSTFDWKVGEKVFAQDGMSRQTIIHAAPATRFNLQLASKILDKCNRYSGNGQQKLVYTADGIKVLSRVWKDGTGEEYFREAIKSIN
ncbi:MAG: hypothetical protein IJQ79_10395 [Bacteroidales bacterium]|nr:hypothetical protein [Bacteroidales bacterium]